MKIAIIGCGVMGEAFARHFVKKHTVILSDRDHKSASTLAKELKAKAVESQEEAIKEADIVLLAVKPKDLTDVSERCGALFKTKKLLISILAGTSVSTLKKQFQKATVLRIMPNLALTCGEGVIGLVEDINITDVHKKQIEGLFEGLGLSFWLPENKIEALTALAASGPAYILVIIETMIEAGVYMGFSANQAKEIVLKTMSGTVSLVDKTKKHPAELKLQIASPGGTTISGLKEIEAMGVRAGMKKALLAAYERGKEMLKLSDG